MAKAPTDTDKALAAPSSNSKHIVVSVDAMGGDKGPSVVVAGTAMAATEQRDVSFLIHGDQAVLAPLVAKHPQLSGRCTIVHAPRTVTMEDKPSQVMRSGQGTSMWSCIDSVKSGDASVAVSCGNTGALMAVSMIRLRRLPEVNRPAIACYWPSRNPAGFNVMLDVGADIRADAEDLLQYAMMGASYARNGLGLVRPRVGLLNVGTEEHKGRVEMKAAHDLISGASAAGAYDFVGFVEGGDIPSNRVDVIVTDGFTGNIALKTGEGTAKLIGDILKQEFMSSILSKIAALFARGSLKRMQNRIDPRLANGGVFLGLKGTVVKSHGSADATGVSAAIRLACQLARSGFQERLAARVASALAPGHHAINQDDNGTQS